MDGQYRFAGAAKPEKTFWRMNAAALGGTAGRIVGGDAREFTALALTSPSVAVRASDDTHTVTEEFALDGLAEGLKALPCAAKLK